MKSFVTLILVFNCSLFISAKSFIFPDVSYSYINVYYFNINNTTSRPASYVYNPTDGFAKDTLKAAFTIQKDTKTKLSQILSKGVDGLLIGLSGCFIPRHGLVFYDDKNNPVASLSICFECGGIRIWSSKSGTAKTKATKLNEKLVEQQMTDLKNVLTASSVLVFDNHNDYILKLNKKEKNTATMTINDNSYVSDLVKYATLDVFKLWVTDKDNMYIDTAKKYTAGGDKYEFRRLRIGVNTFLFESVQPNAILADATIKSREIRLPNGIQVGQTKEFVVNTFKVYDGMSNPDIIKVVGDKYEIIYTFENNLLQSITIGYK